MSSAISRSDITPNQYLPTLDGWRAVAIILVLFAHSIFSIQNFFASFGIYTNLAGFSVLGLLGVHIFFVISGFLITRNMLKEENAKGRLSIGSFYYRRLFRIIPAALVFLTFIALLSSLHIIDVSVPEWLAALFFWANYSHAHKSWYTGHFWSLAVEEHFYIFWPFLFVLLNSNKKRSIFLITIAIAIAFWRFFSYKYWLTGDSAEYFWGRTDVQVDNIVYGALAAVLYEFVRFKKLINLLLKFWLPLLALIIALIIVQSLLIFPGVMQFTFMSINPALLSIMFICLILHRKGFIFSILETKLLKKIGIISYSTYLWQQLFLNKSDFVPPQLAFVQSFPVNFLCVFSCAFLSYRFVEVPMIRLGRRLARVRNSVDSPEPEVRHPSGSATGSLAIEPK